MSKWRLKTMKSTITGTMDFLLIAVTSSSRKTEYLRTVSGESWRNQERMLTSATTTSSVTSVEASLSAWITLVVFIWKTMPFAITWKRGSIAKRPQVFPCQTSISDNTLEFQRERQLFTLNLQSWGITTFAITRKLSATQEKNSRKVEKNAATAIISLIYCSKCNIAAYCSRDCQRVGSKKHKALCAVVAGQYSVSVELKPHFDGEGVTITRTFGPHLKGIGKGPKLNPKSHKRFIVKIQTQQLNGHPLQLLIVYDRSLTIDCFVQSPEAFRIVMECGVLGSLNKFTSKKAYFWAVFAEGGKKLTIFLSDLAPLQEW